MKTSSRLLKILSLIFCIIVLSLAVSSCAETELDRTEELGMIQAANKLGDNYIIVSFPGLGVEPQMINKEAFKIGSLSVYWYGIIFTVGMILGVTYTCFLSRREKIEADNLIDMGIWGTVGGIVGARLYYVLASLNRYTDNFWSVFNIWDGGMAIYGALIGGGIAIALVCHIKKINLLKSFDVIAPGVMIGQIIGRWGDFVSGSAYGNAVVDGELLAPFKMGIYPHAQLDNYVESIGGMVTGSNALAYVHPTFLYESLWNLIGFAIINIFGFRKKKFDGQIFFMYLAWYGFGRTFIELIRTDSLYIFGTVRISAVVGCLCFFAGVAMLAHCAVKGKKKRLAEEEYESAYPLFHKEDKNNEGTQKTENGKEEKKNATD